MSGQSKRMESLQDEGSGLQQRLATLLLDQRKNLATNRRVNYGLVKQSDFVDQNLKLMDVTSRITHDSTKDILRNKTETRQKMKVEKELQDCTFQPHLNKNTDALLSGYVSVLERPMPRKEITAGEGAKMEVEATNERPEHEANASPRKRPNMNFYQEKMEWKSSVEEAKLKERMQKEEESQKLPDFKPVTNMERNLEVVKRDGDFLTRVQKDIQRSKEVRLQLEEEVYGKSCTFTPRIKSQPGATSKIHKM